MREGMKSRSADLAAVRLMTESALDRPMSSTGGQGAVRIVCRLGWACLVHVHPFWFGDGVADMRGRSGDATVVRVPSKAIAAHAGRAGTLFDPRGVRDLGSSRGSIFRQGQDGTGAYRSARASGAIPRYECGHAGGNTGCEDVGNSTSLCKVSLRCILLNASARNSHPRPRFRGIDFIFSSISLILRSASGDHKSYRNYPGAARCPSRDAAFSPPQPPWLAAAHSPSHPSQRSRHQPRPGPSS